MKNILFTGARSGIAHAVIQRLITAPYHIYVTVHTDKQLERVKKMYQEYKNVTCFKLDITSKEDLKQLQPLEIDILVNNAAIGEGGSLTEMDMNRVRHNFEVNVFSTFEIVQLILKKMIQKGEGKIIMLGSLAGMMPLPFLGSYCGTKASIIKMTTVLKKEINLLNPNIHIVLIEPGLYKTGFNQVMLQNKYDEMHYHSYFDRQLESIRSRETWMCALLEKRNLDSIAKKIECAIKSNHPKFIYRAPMSQVIAAKMFELFLQ